MRVCEWGIREQNVFESKLPLMGMSQWGSFMLQGWKRSLSLVSVTSNTWPHRSGILPAGHSFPVHSLTGMRLATDN